MNSMKIKLKEMKTFEERIEWVYYLVNDGFINAEQLIELMAAIVKMGNKTPLDESENSFNIIYKSIDCIMKSDEVILNTEKATMDGVFQDLEAMKIAFEKFYKEHIFMFGYTLSEAPYHGWKGDSLKNMKGIDRYLCEKSNEIYAMILKGLGQDNVLREVNENENDKK